RSRRWPSRRRTTRAPPPSTSRAFHLPMAAFQVSTYGRFWVSTEVWMEKRLVYGVSINNNPTVQDLWNSTPAWRFPYASSAVAPTPTASPLIDGVLAQKVVGATAYAMWDDVVYA